ncbi:MAG: hypothetical protein V1809_14310 [Planctomycetota bacterium]
MNKAAYSAIEQAWQACVKVRALCPSTRKSAIGRTEYKSTNWFEKRGVTYFVRPQVPLTQEGLNELQQMTAFVNRSFIIVMAAILESYDVVPYCTTPDLSLDGGEHVLLVKWLRNRFAHGDYDYNPTDKSHVETRQLLEKLLPATKTPEMSGFPAAIDKVLEPLKDGVLQYISKVDTNVDGAETTRNNTNEKI